MTSSLIMPPLRSVAVRKQVQRLGVDEQPAKIGGYGTISQKLPSGHKVVHIGGAQQSVEALLPYGDQIDKSSMSELVAGILAMIEDSDNIVANRTGLVSCLSGFMDRLPEDMVGRVVALLEPLAAGQIVESTIVPRHAETTNPLNPFKLGTGKPASLQGAALLALATLDRLKPGVVVGFHRDILLSAIASSNLDAPTSPR